MQAQEYLDKEVEKLKAFIKINTEKRAQLENIFKEKGAKEEKDVAEILKSGDMSDEDIETYHYASLMSNDVQTLSRKVADFINFNSLLGTELNTDRLTDINGFTEFLRDYMPYETNFLLTPENQTKETNPEMFKKHKEAFKKTILNKGLLDFINEARN